MSEVEKFLTNLSPDFKDWLNLFSNTTTTNSFIVKGFMQSRKTWLIASISLYYYLIKNIPVFIIVENKLDTLEQMSTRLEKVFFDLEKNCRNLTILDIQRGKKTDAKEMTDAFGENPRVFISLRSNYDLKPVNDMIEEIEGSGERKCVVIVDESDCNDNERKSLSQTELERLKSFSSCVWNITATAITTLMKEEIETSSVFIMKKPEYYKDITSFKLNNINEVNYLETDLLEDTQLLEYLADFSTRTPYKLTNGQKHPHISLLKLTSVIKPQLALSEYIYKNYPKEIVVITYNGTGVTLKGEHLPKRCFKCKDSYSTFFNGTHFFKKSHIGDILTYLHENGNVEKFPRIIILAGLMADRGITFGSTNYNECLKKDLLPWHLTEMYYMVSKNTSQPDLLQACGRLCGIYSDDIPLTLYSNACADLIKAYHAQEELIQRAINKKTESKKMKEIIPTVPLSKNKCCKKRSFTSGKVHCKIKKVADDKNDGGWDWFQDEKEEREGDIFIVNPDLLTNAKAKIVSHVIDQIPETNKWISRSVIVNLLVENKKYLLNTIRSDLTRLQQIGERSKEPKYGLNFRKIKNSEELELLYFP